MMSVETRASANLSDWQVSMDSSTRSAPLAQRAVLVCALLSSAALDVQANANSHAGPVPSPNHQDAWPAVGGFEVASMRWLDRTMGAQTAWCFAQPVRVRARCRNTLLNSRITGPLFSRLLTLPGQLVLSESAPTGTGSLQSRGPDGSRGYVATGYACHDSGRMARTAILAAPRPFSVLKTMPAGSMRHQVCNIAGHSDEVKSDVLRRLRKLGWVRDDISSTDGMGWSSVADGNYLLRCLFRGIIYAQQVQEGSHEYQARRF